jgi:DNA-binding GntR family transcriptional regulator
VLGLSAGQQAIMRKRHMYANNVPVQLAPSYIPIDIAEGTAIEQSDSGPGGIVSRFADLGYAQVRITESVRVRRATDEEQTFLQLEEDKPVIEIVHTDWTARTTPTPGEHTYADLESVLEATPQEFESPILRHPDQPGCIGNQRYRVAPQLSRSQFWS